MKFYVVRNVCERMHAQLYVLRRGLTGLMTRVPLRAYVWSTTLTDENLFCTAALASRLEGLAHPK